VEAVVVVIVQIGEPAVPREVPVMVNVSPESKADGAEAEIWNVFVHCL
jgi:hypothetical protein